MRQATKGGSVLWNIPHFDDLQNFPRPGSVPHHRFPN
jgi:hypothetical protein